MKQSFMLILMAVCGFVGNAAAHEYMPLVEEGKTWITRCLTTRRARLCAMRAPPSAHSR